MKKSLLLSLLLLFVSAIAFANTGGQFGVLSDDGDPMPNHTVSYDLRTGDPFVYNHTIEEQGYYIDNFNLPFAYD